jgi:hypothetical protein
MEEDRLAAIDVKLNALLAIAVDSYLRETGVAKPRPRSVDKLLNDVGLNQAEIARLLGKSSQAVGQVLAKKKSSAKKRSTKGRRR